VHVQRWQRASKQPPAPKPHLPKKADLDKVPAFENGRRLRDYQQVSLKVSSAARPGPRPAGPQAFGQARPGKARQAQ
jgi:hypothetical protein